MTGRIAVDVGGTFTDLVYRDDSDGTVLIGKGPTDAERPDRGVMALLESSLPPERIASATHFMHGTTVGLNALLQRRGATVGLITTRGFRDVLEVRRGDREDMFDAFWSPPPPLVERALRTEVRERVLATGAVHEELQEDDVRTALELFRAESVNSIAVILINAYTNAVHELAVEAELRRLGFDGFISLSHRLSGEYREYERSTTTVIDAFVRPVTSAYLERLETSLRSAGFAGSSFITRSGGGALTFADAQARPFETVLSGPVGGVEGSAQLAAGIGHEHLVTADVGGTSFDTCLVVNGRPSVLYQGEIAGYPVQTQWVDIRTIGAGGGSIAYKDLGGLLRVGPRSAGSAPGPVCYGRGGAELTTTDAAFLLGMLGSGRLAGGLSLDRGGAQDVADRLGQEIGLSSDALCRGVLVIAAASMANAIREITVEKGQDPRKAALVMFGGAGPMFGTLLMDELAIETMVVPPHAGNFSAVGLLGTNVARSLARTKILMLDDRFGAVAATELDMMFTELWERVGLDQRASTVEEVALDLRYHGQEHTLTIHVEVESGSLLEAPERIRARFDESYAARYGRALSDPVEAVAIRASLLSALSGERVLSIVGAEVTAEPIETVSAYSFRTEGWREFPVIARAGIAVHEPIIGPAIIVEETTTTYLDAGFTAALDVASGSLMITRTEVQK